MTGFYYNTRYHNNSLP